MKHEFETVLYWLSEIKRCIPHIIQLLIDLNNEESVFKFLQLFKAALISRSPYVVSLTSQVLSQFRYALNEVGSNEFAWRWFSDRNYGIIHVSSFL